MDKEEPVPHEREPQILGNIAEHKSIDQVQQNIVVHPAIAIFYEDFEIKIGRIKYMCIVTEYFIVSK